MTGGVCVTRGAGRAELRGLQQRGIQPRVDLASRIRQTDALPVNCHKRGGDLVRGRGRSASINRASEQGSVKQYV